MAMSPRLLRPRASSGYGLDARDWQSRVVANGGTVSASTMKAVDTFCKTIVTAGIRDRFYRLNLFAGTGLSAALVPLFRGPSLGGTQYGNTTDTNNNFVSGDYVETGTGGGISTGAANATKTLDTGLVPFNAGMVHTDSHGAFYSRQGNTSTGAVMASTRAVAGSEHFQFFINGVSGSVTQIFRSGGSSNSGFETVAALRTGHIIAQRSGGTGSLYRNGTNQNATSATTNATTWSTGFPAGIRIYGRRFINNTTEVTDQFMSTTLQGYSIGVAFTDSQASSYYTAMQALQTELGRQL
jgi:hypothetical protein